jgi:hypothetical protein
MHYLVRAIHNLCPNAEFTFQEQDYSTVNWVKLDGTAPTLTQINAEIERIKNQDEQDIVDKARAKAELLTKLGITAEEALLLLS